MEFAPDGIGRLVGQGANFLVAKLFVCHEQKQEPILRGQLIEGGLDSLAQFLYLEDPQRAFARRAGRFPNRFIGIAENVPPMPCLAEVLAMVNSDAVKPGPNTGIASELVHLAICLSKDIVGGVFRLGRIAQEPQRQVVDRPGMCFVDGAEFTRNPGGARLRACKVASLFGGGSVVLAANGFLLHRLGR